MTNKQRGYLLLVIGVFGLEIITHKAVYNDFWMLNLIISIAFIIVGVVEILNEKVNQ